MTLCTVSILLLIYRGPIRQFTTAAVVQLVQQKTVTTTWFRHITADRHLLLDHGAWHARYLRGHKAVMLEAAGAAGAGDDAGARGRGGAGTRPRHNEATACPLCLSSFPRYPKNGLPTFRSVYANPHCRR